MDVGTALGNLVSAIGIRQEEADLITQLKAGSEEAFAWLVATYHQPVYSLIARTLPAHADAADITQEVFVKIYRGISGFHGDASLRTWIYRIALHEASNQRRWWSRHCRQEVTIEAETGESSDGQTLCIRDTLVDEHESPF
jgi:RNA polymerase sigma-70 factor, ECF subfamily